MEDQRQKQFMRIAMARLSTHYPFEPQRLAIASKMYSRWIERNNNIEEEELHKEKLISKITLLDTAMYRTMGLNDTPQMYRHEPPKFRSKLHKIYSKLSTEDLEELVKLKQR